MPKRPAIIALVALLALYGLTYRGNVGVIDEATMLAVTSFQQGGYEGDHGVDNAFLGRASDAGKPVVYSFGLLARTGIGDRCAQRAANRDNAQIPKNIMFG